MNTLDTKHYNLCYSWFCLIILVCTFISQSWSKQILNSMYGFGVEGKDKDSFYMITMDVEGLDMITYSYITGPA